MKYTSHIISAGSGSVAGATYSHNAAGQYIRARVIPVNPNTTYQQLVRSYLGTLSNHWLNTLTAAQREAWETYALNVALTDALGSQFNASGINHYCRSNVPRLQAGLARVDDAPTLFTLGEFSPVTFTKVASDDSIAVAFDNTDDWANEDGSAMLVFESRSYNPTINYFKGPYRYNGKIEGDSVTPPSSPFANAGLFPCEEGQRVFFRVSVTRADGRLSPSFRDGIFAAA